jgi:hypothetical protein
MRETEIGQLTTSECIAQAAVDSDAWERSVRVEDAMVGRGFWGSGPDLAEQHRRNVAFAASSTEQFGYLFH